MHFSRIVFYISFEAILLIPDKLMFWTPALSTKSCGSTSTPCAKLSLSAFQNHPYLAALMSLCLWSGCSAGFCMSAILKYFMTIPWLLVIGMSFYSSLKLVLLLCLQPWGMTQPPLNSHDCLVSKCHYPLYLADEETKFEHHVDGK